MYNGNNFNTNSIKSNSVFMPQDSYEWNLQNAYDIGYARGAIDTKNYIDSKVPKGGLYTKNQLKAYGVSCALMTTGIIFSIKLVKDIIKTKKNQKELAEAMMEEHFNFNNDKNKNEGDDLFE